MIPLAMLAVLVAAIAMRGRRHVASRSFETRQRRELRYGYSLISSRGIAEGFVLRFSIPRGLEFALTGETWFDRWCKEAGLASEFESGDSYVDRRYFLDSDDPVLRDGIRTHPEFARLLGSFDAQLNLHALEATELRARDGSLEVRLMGKAADRGGLEAQVVDLLEPFVAALQGVPPRARGERDRTFAPRVVHVGAWLLGTLGSIFLWVFCSDRLAHPMPLFWASVPFSVAVLAATLAGSWRWIGPGARRHRTLAACLLVGLPGFVLSGFLFARALDLTLPQAEPEAYAVQGHLTSRYVRRMGTVYGVSFHGEDRRAWGYSPITLSTPEYERLSEAWGSARDREATLLVHPGALGAPWVEIELGAPLR